ncbi:MAG: response regulator [Deferribacterales bacterium]
MKSILFVEDEEIFYALFKIIGDKFRFEPTIVSNIKDAKEMIEHKNFYMAIIDYQLPDGNGVELNDFIKKNYPSIITVFASGFGVSFPHSSNFDYSIDKSDLLNFFRGFLDNR